MNENARETFEQFLEELFYEQYADDLAKSDPEEYKLMFEAFRNEYGLPLHA